MCLGFFLIFFYFITLNNKNKSLGLKVHMNEFVTKR